MEHDVAGVAVAPSPLRRRLKRQLGIDPVMLDARLAEIGSGMRSPSGSMLQEAGETQLFLWLIQEGWAIGSVNLANGQRFVDRIYRPGDIVGLKDINWNYATTNVEAVTDLRGTSIRKSDLVDLLRRDAGFASGLLAIAMLDQVIATDRARANAKMKAPERLLHLLLSLQGRARACGECDRHGWFEMPLTQRQVADALGISTIHANRAFRTLLDEGLLERRDRRYRITRFDEAVARCDWIDRDRTVAQDELSLMVA